MPWSKLQESDTFMRVVAIAGGIIAFIESILHLMNLFEFWTFGWVIELIAVGLAILPILLGLKPIHYTPTFLGIIGLALIIFSVFVGGIIVFLASIIGAVS
ncbi:MAG: hypothetical protein JSV62_06150 [Promethearchaeota archaeon]|nr:MAG: hypothetical protein JSV62_06150 [Candidatus Lokiarchaeota archaeon]